MFAPAAEPKCQASPQRKTSREVAVPILWKKSAPLFGLVALLPAIAQAQLLAVTVELGELSVTKLPFVMAAEAGIYRRNGLDVRQYITPRAAELIRLSSGLIVPKDFVGTGLGDINIGGGSP